ncbi:threonine/homoserine/homoserine lactone efflux protein [Streptosporangium becharense]|uniref:Threonine/homoserine/homoserine lactone efflux protein n=1 Tax=Streptosporangium becharense TaxID=1816182 RepID=A0A7W9IEE8_9ACTN|nr:LysE family translocator [Streptosporangium becharense]MBB2909832.1 threonine/homoserine/homoserine lactone efflux protein [Streptosporangium becharense]MBB5819213.1 threonine/homoserine/homoserine lactone efflux protein [Streptosporangium becharense]
MPDLATVALFVVATLALLLVPGPAVLYIVTRSVTQGRSAGLVSVLGIHLGSLVHVAAAALGVSALLAASATAFTIVKYLGAAYLVYLGIRKLMARPGGDGVVEPPVASTSRLFWEGFVVNVLNPKTAIFFLAFLPQFADPAAGPIAPQIVLLGLIWTVLGMVSDGAYALLSSAMAGRLRRSARARRRLDLTSGFVYLGMGAFAALGGEGGAAKA